MISKKEKIYAWAMLAVAFILLGTCGALEWGFITLAHAFIQMGACGVIAIALAYMIWLEETRTARKRR